MALVDIRGKQPWDRMTPLEEQFRRLNRQAAKEVIVLRRDAAPTEGGIARIAVMGLMLDEHEVPLQTNVYHPLLGFGTAVGEIGIDSVV